MKLFPAFLSLLAISALLGSANGQVETVPPGGSAQSGWVAFHSGWAHLAGEDLRGSVSTPARPGAGANAKVSLLKNGVVQRSTLADENGAFVFASVNPGVYGITVESDEVCGAISFEAVPAPAGGAIPFQVYAATMPKALVEDIWASMWAPPSEVVYRPQSFAQLAAPVGTKVAQTERVVAVDGRVRGQLAFDSNQSVPTSQVIKVYRNGSLVATERVNESGQFSFAAEPGIVDVVVGGNAFACIAVDVVAAPGVAAQSEGSTRFVSTNAVQPGAADQLLIPVIGSGQSSEEAPPVVEPVLPIEFAGGGFAGPGGFGGGSGGGGGGGRGGGGGALLGLAGLAVGVTALADDDDGFNLNQASLIAP